MKSNSDTANKSADMPTHLKDVDTEKTNWREKDEAYWKENLTPEQYAICRGQGTERAFTGKYYHFDKDGNYRCAACGQILFNSKTKFDSGSGWPSFSEPATKEALETIEDFSHGMHRVEVRCKRCGAHLGHVFPDGPGPTGERYCINSACLFHEEEPNK